MRSFQGRFALLIGLDIGNTNITVGLFDEGAGHISPRHALRLNTVHHATSDEVAAPLLAHLAHLGISPDSIGSAIVSSVVPVLDRTIREMLERVFSIRRPVFVDWQTDTGLTFEYPNPAEIGADRIVNAAAGIALYGMPLILVDFGTATTFCCVSADGAYLGGEILPGVGISLQALTSRAAKLSSVSIERPSAAIGKSTTAGMVAGLYYQTIGAIEKISSEIKKEMGSPSPRVIATGGFANLFRDGSECIDVIDIDLTLKGLKLIHERIVRCSSSPAL